MHTIELTQEQAKQIAFNIYKDIPAFIKSHHKEYQAFLEQEKAVHYE
ncbi:MAG: hypothetical protein R3Y09_06235 [Clostridia bacterium]